LSYQRHHDLGRAAPNGRSSTAVDPLVVAAQSEIDGRSASAYWQMLDALPIVAFMASAAGSITYVSRGWAEFTGYPAGEAIGAGYREIIDPEQADAVAANWLAAISAGLEYRDEFRIRLSDGRYRWVLTAAAPVRDTATGEVSAWFGTVTDIDERRRTADALVDSESMYRALSEAIPGAVWAASTNGELIYLADRSLELEPGFRDRALGNAWLTSVHADDRQRVSAVWQHSYESGEPYNVEYRLLNADGTYHWSLVRALPVHTPDGSILRWVGVITDIQDRHEADEKREMYVALVENSTDFIAIADLDGKVIYVNAAGRKLLGIGSLDDARNSSLIDYFGPQDWGFVQSDVLPAVDRHGHWNGDFQLRHFRSGKSIPVAYNLFAITSADGTRIGTATVSRDLRDRKRIEEGLRLLSRTGAAIVDSLDYKRTLHNIARAFVEGFAAYCLIDVIPEHGPWERTALHRDPAFVTLLTDMSRPSGNHPIARAIEAGESCVSAINEDWIRGLDAPLNADRAEVIRRLGVRSVVCVPVKTPSGAVVGALTCALDRTSDRDDYGVDDLGFVEEVGRRAGAAIANVALYERERRIALELQAAALPTNLPAVDGIVIDAAYRPGSAEAKIGGDWYDAFLLADGRLVMTVGDVVGHGLQAAVSMTKLRLAMQSAAIVNPDPNLMLRVADATLRLSTADAYATAIAAVYDPKTRLLTFAAAGHPNPILRTIDGALEEFSNRGPMIGLRTGEENKTCTVTIPPGSSLVFFTDGLVEFVRDIDEGTRRLAEALGAGDLIRKARPADAIVTAVLGTDVAHDDIAVLVVSFR